LQHPAEVMLPQVSPTFVSPLGHWALEGVAMASTRQEARTAGIQRGRIISVNLGKPQGF